MATLLLSHLPRPVLHVDWSDVNETRAYQMLRASVAMPGRAMTVYEECLPITKLSNRKVMDNFLNQLKYILPSTCQPIIITDAGFHSPWFTAVEKLGRDYVGRVRSACYIRVVLSRNEWCLLKSYYCAANSKVQYLGDIEMARSSQFPCHAYLYKGAKVGRIKKGKMGKRSNASVSFTNARRQIEPWFLVSSLSPVEVPLKRIASLYKKRMQIEEAFRDSKSHAHGLGLRMTRSRSQLRLDNLMLLVSLALFYLWLIGTAIKLLGYHHQLQANTIKHRNVLSVITIGMQRMDIPIPLHKLNLKQALIEIQRLAAVENYGFD